MKVYFYTAGVLCCCFSVASQAQEVEGGIDLITSHFRYEEPNFMEMKGSMIGIGGDIAVRNNGLMLGLQGSYIEGDIDYTSNGSGSDDGVPNSIWEVRGLVGTDMAGQMNTRVTPYTGLGFRRLFDDHGGRQTTTGANAYDRIQDYLYLPIGIAVQTESTGWQVRGELEYDYLIRGENQTNLSDAGNYPDLKFTQKNGYGLRASLTLSTAVNLGVISSLGITPYFKYWNIDRSNVNSGYLEPSNNSTELGLKARLGF
ncbi:autotransporter outer membrane beta-barrel domain-containing protein [Vibrio viridaestus]|uniref:Autotransporter outer membrane beta-barrel domain-containing protein n=1 Tax=Vibrio viridaestus TaxID=2487322 RepID=A0A3N9TJJ9_9VIBR|nr:autotransporter outer membrane beta-barrel domain-containing protein [Vibrio viridaestus]RQW64370.1 autotransporter outer membrane beta-barrel domain-containing protein [Vibrio viridaestus]